MRRQRDHTARRADAGFSQHARGAGAPGGRQRDLTLGALAARIVSVRTAATAPGRDTVTVITAPAFRPLEASSISDTRPETLRLVSDLRAQPPRQVAVTVAPSGTRLTASSRRRVLAPCDSNRKASVTTIGTGLAAAAGLTTAVAGTSPGAGGVSDRCGCAVVTVNERRTGAGSSFPTASVARTSKVCGPSASELVVNGDEHGANDPVSTLQAKVAPGSSAVKVNVGVASSIAPDGPSTVVSGATVSTVSERAPQPPAFVAASIARASKVCLPSASEDIRYGESQAFDAPPSMRHSNRAPGSLDRSVNAGAGSLVDPDGPSMTSSGGVVSTAKGCDATVPMLPSASSARTSNVCAPSASVAAVNGDEHAANCAPSRRHCNVAADSKAAKKNVGVESLGAGDG